MSKNYVSASHLIRNNTNHIRYSNYKDTNSIPLCKELGYKKSSFRYFLSNPFNEDMILDLSKCNLLEVLQYYIQIRSKIIHR